MERKKRMLTGLAVAGVLAGALAGGGVALADSGGSAPATASVAAAAAPAATVTPAAGTVARGGVRFLRRARAGRLVLRTSASYLGLTPAALRTELRAGKSLASIASAEGKSVSGLENAIVAAAVKRIDASKLTPARKAAVIADVKANVGAFVTTTHPFEWAARRLGHASRTAVGTPATSTPAASSSGQPA
jgi:hypothetical protein